MTASVHRSRRRGFTLPEVLATMVMTGIILPVAMRGVTVCMRASAAARQQLEAGQLAQGKINELLTTRDQTSFQGAGDFGADWPGYRWDVQSQNVAFTTYEVTVSVYWMAQGQERVLRMSTFVYPAGTSTVTTGTEGTTS